MTLSEVLVLDQISRIKRISTSYIPRPSQFQIETQERPVTPRRHRAPRSPKPKQPLPIRHGTLRGYSNGKCRCESCRTAWNTYQLRRQTAARAEHRLLKQAQAAARLVHFQSSLPYQQEAV